MAELGNDAKPKRIQGFVKERFGIDMTNDHVSVCKKGILKQGRGKDKPAAATPGDQEPAATKPAVPRPAAVQKSTARKRSIPAPRLKPAREPGGNGKTQVSA
jgi:hypothetical protein